MSFATSGNGYHALAIMALPGTLIEVELISAMGQFFLSTDQVIDDNGHLSLQLPGTLASGFYLATARTPAGIQSLPVVIH
jgi:hypothetical protein